MSDDHHATPARRRRPAARDRVVTALARVLARRFFRSVETVGDLPRRGPVILAASHLNGFVDPVLLVARVGVLPRFLAKGTLWNVVAARPFLRFARIIPVHRRQDHADGVDNRDTFAAAIDALAADHLVAVFPEGTTHDDVTLRPLRTGMARIALAAAARGVEGVQLVPVGITYGDKVAVRGRALVHVGEPIAVVADEHTLDADGEPAAAQVRALTERVREALVDLTSDFGSVEEALGLSAAAAVSLRPAPAGTEAETGAPPTPAPRRTAEVSMAATAERTRALAASGPAVVDEVVTTVARYGMLLRHVRLSDAELVDGVGPSTLARRAAVLGALVVVLAPVALAGLFANLVPVVAVLVVGLVPDAPVTKGTVRLLVAAVVFPLTWLVLAFWDFGIETVAELSRTVTFPIQPVLQAGPGDRSGFWAGLAVFVAIPVFGVVTLVVADRFRELIASVLTWRTLTDRRGQLDDVRAKRAEVVAVVEAALAGQSGSTQPPTSAASRSASRGPSEPSG